MKLNKYHNTSVNQEQQFDEVVSIILQHKSRASQAVNNEALLMAWHVGAYVSRKLKNEEWGSGVVNQLAEHIRSRQPELKGYSRRSIYNMVMFYEEYSSPTFANALASYIPTAIVQPVAAQLPDILSYTTFTNHIVILSNCKSTEHRLFYILYSHKERLGKRELLRCISNRTFESLAGSKGCLSKGMLEAYPTAPYMFKDTLFVDLLFFHRGLQALVAVELKRTKFHPRDLGQLEFYLEALDRDVKRTNENPSIGIILCPEADHIVVEYAMSRSMSPTMVAEYKRVLIPQERMQEQFREFCQFLIEDK